MTANALDHPAVAQYLSRLDAATAHLPLDERTEIAEGIRSHLIAALAEARTEADVRSALDALGAPEEIVGAPPAAPPPPQPQPAFTRPQRTSARGLLEIAAVILLLVGAFILPGIGWVVGVVLLWVSKAWTVPEKLLGTFVVPGGLGLFFVLMFLPFGVETCYVQVTGDGPLEVCAGGIPLWLTIAIMLLVVVGPVLTAVYLLRAAGRRPAPG